MRNYKKVYLGLASVNIDEVVKEHLQSAFMDLDNIIGSSTDEEFGLAFEDALDNNDRYINKAVEAYYDKVLETISEDELKEIAKNNIDELNKLYGDFDLEDIEGSEYDILHLQFKHKKRAEKLICLLTLYQFKRN